MKAGYTVFFDKEELKPGDVAAQEMLDAADTCRIAFVVLSEHYVRKWWPIRELGIFMERLHSRKDIDVWPLYYRLLPNDIGKLGGWQQEHSVELSEKFEKIWQQWDEWGKEGSEVNKNKVEEILKQLSKCGELAGVVIDKKDTIYESDYKYAARVVEMLKTEPPFKKCLSSS
ncbi:unnamed protein product [Chrysoparadoxa australica]